MGIEHNSCVLAILDDDESVQIALQDLIESEGLSALCFGSAEQFLDSTARYEVLGGAAMSIDFTLRSVKT